MLFSELVKVSVVAELSTRRLREMTGGNREGKERGEITTLYLVTNQIGERGKKGDKDRLKRIPEGGGDSGPQKGGECQERKKEHR